MSIPRSEPPLVESQNMNFDLLMPLLRMFIRDTCRCYYFTSLSHLESRVTQETPPYWPCCRSFCDAMIRLFSGSPLLYRDFKDLITFRRPRQKVSYGMNLPSKFQLLWPLDIQFESFSGGKKDAWCGVIS